MKLLLAGLLMALVLVSEVVGLVALARYSASTEAHPPEQGSFTVVSAQGDDGNYQWVEWEGSSCGVWEVRREVEPRVNSPESEGGVNGEEGDCKGVRIKPHLASTRHRGVDRPTGGHRPEPTTSENSPSRHLGE
jgi:hypothetical protein